jgi:hypothetical protein
VCAGMMWSKSLNEVIAVDESSVIVKESNLGLEYWAAGMTLSAHLQESIRQADIVVVPFEGFREHSGPVFPEGTETFFHFLREKSKAVEIAVEDDDYKEVAIHFAVLSLATVVIKETALALGAAWIIEYVRDWTGRHGGNAKVRANLVIEQRNGEKKRALKLSYEGPANTFENALKEAIFSLPTIETPIEEIADADDDD